MGTWGPGNFDDDTAADHLSLLVSRLVDEIDVAPGDPAALEPDEYWGVAVPCNVEILATIAEKQWVGCALPSPRVIERWRETYLGVWERGIDALEPAPEDKRQRREVLRATFDHLIELASQQS